VVEAARLHRARDRKERGLTLVEGPHMLADVVTAGAEVRQVFSLDGTEGSIPVDARAMARLAGTETPRGPVAVVAIPMEWLDRSRNLLVSAGVSDPGNLGTMIRTAAAFGWGFASLEGSADPWAPKTIRSGAGSQFQIPVARIGSMADVGEWSTIATVVRGGVDGSEITGRPVARVIGEEAHGLDDKLIAACDHRMTIPTPGPPDSLNAAVAAGIAVYELSRGSGDSQGGV
jgi:TrmH family RNA methyltransferase